ncbi:glycosyltransferase [Candidatus Saccharibacteria bacterium]|nr:glycosyltransferase [Candidatus Saccharibacteria bacterium]
MYISKKEELSIKKTRVMFCTTHWRTGGMERKMSNLFGELVKYHDVYLLTVGRSGGKIKVPSEVTNVVVSEKEYKLAYSRAAIREALKHKVDVVVGVMNLFSGQLDLYEECKKNHIKTIAANSEYFFYPYLNANNFGIVGRRQKVFADVDAVLWQTNFSASVYAHINSNGYVVPNPNTFPVQDKLAAKDEKIVLCVGRFNDYVKRIDRALLCFSKVLISEPNARLLIVGPCDIDLQMEELGNKSIRDLMMDLNISYSQVSFIGEVGMVEKYYQRASVLLLTSNNEGFSNVISEAACFGLPVVYNEIPGHDDLVVDGLTGFAVKQDDMDSLADKVVEVLRNDELRERMGREASRHVSQFDIKNIASKWNLVIDRVTSKATDIENKRLIKELGFKINDYFKFSTLLTSELNRIFQVSLGRNVVLANQLLHMEDKLNSTTIRLTSELDELKSQYQAIVNSKAWRLASLTRHVVNIPRLILKYLTNRNKSV